MGQQADFPLKLESVFFTKLVFETLFDHDPSGKQEVPFLPDNNISVQTVPENGNIVAVNFSTKVNAERNITEPYFIDIECIALFTFIDGMPESEVIKAATITGNSVCYGAIREVISWTTGRLPYGQINVGLSVLTTNNLKISKKTE